MESLSDTELRLESQQLVNAAITEDKAKNYEIALDLYQSALKYYLHLIKCS